MTLWNVVANEDKEHGALASLVAKQRPVTDRTTRRSGRGREQRVAVIVIVIGVAHFLVPRIFDPINRLGFAEQARMFTYINGAIETTIGVMMANPRTRRQSTIVSACYVIHLTSNIVRNQVRIRRGDSHESRWLE
ncbi:hypothetical protein [Mycobacterium alsense]|uniref:hypothetical protein n=1 Tax=Mycobacterium alsense TaxID=324058 RepID=UPI000A863957|nr:hypothetical protein [Mycobacterium alsense]